MSKQAWSWSRLSDFEKCGLMAYWKHYAPKGARCPFIVTPPLERGKAIHKDLELSILGKPLPPDLQHMTLIIEGLKRNIAEGWWVNAEYKLTFTEHYAECGWFDREAYLRCVLDIVSIKGNVANVLDWKTGKVNPVSSQLKLFATATMTRWPRVETVGTSFVWVDHQEVTQEVYHRDELIELTEEFEERSMMIQIAWDENNWIANPSDFNCKWCPCTKAQCKYSKKD